MYLMRRMSDFDVRAINLNLLPALEALLAEGSVGGAARRVHVSQSAMSHSLKKLREVLGDPLFVPSGRRLVPTERAKAMRQQISTALDALADAVRPEEAFDPKTATRTFRIATVDYFELTTLPGLLAYLRAHAPHVQLEIERITPTHLSALAAGEIDLALVGGATPVPAGVRRHVLYDDPFAVIVRPDHPAVGRKLDLPTYLGLGHVLVSVEGRRDGVVDRALEARGQARRVALRVPHFMSAPLAVLSSDWICTIARTVALEAHHRFGVRVLPPPLPLSAATVVALSPRRHDGDPAARWFLSLFTAGRGASPEVKRLLRARARSRQAASG